MRTLKSLDSTFLKELASGLSEYWKIRQVIPDLDYLPVLTLVI